MSIRETIKNKIRYAVGYYELRSELLLIRRLNSISRANTEAFARFKNVNKGKTVVLVAAGPSLKTFKPIDGCLYCGVNRTFLDERIKLDYLFIQDYGEERKSTFVEKSINYDCEKFYGIFDHKTFSNIPEQMGIEANANRYYFVFGYNPYVYNEYVRDICNEPLGDPGSVVFCAMQFILYTNPDKILLVGCDCSNKGYFTGEQQGSTLPTDRIINGWKRMKEFAEIHYPRTKIISINPVGLKGIFEDIYQ